MQQLINFDDETEKKVETIKQRHNSEIKLLESRWKQSRLRPYNKLSPSLRDLTGIEEMASTVGDFTTARSIHSDIMNKQKEEIQEAQYKADSEYNMILVSLIQRQGNELSNFLDTRLHKRELLVRKQQNELNTIEDKANISKYRIDNNKPFKSSDPNLPARGLIRPFIQSNQVNASSGSPKLLHTIRPPPLKNGGCSSQRSSSPKRVLKCVPKTRHKINLENKEFDVMNAMEILKKRFSKMTQEKEKTPNSTKKSKLKKQDDDLFDFNAYYENQRNPAHLKTQKKKKTEETVQNQPYYEPVKRKMNVQSIMKKVKDIEENKRKPPVIHSLRKPLKPPKRTRKFGEEEEYEDYDDADENAINTEFKQKIDVDPSLNIAYERITDDKNILKNKVPKQGVKEIDNKERKLLFDDEDIKPVDIVKKKRSKQIEKLFRKEKNPNDLKLYYCAQDNIINAYDYSYNSYSSDGYGPDINNMNKTNSDEKDSLSQDLIVKRHKKRISKSAQEASGEYSYSSYYYDYSVDDKENKETGNTYKDKNGNDIIIVKGDVFIEKPSRKTYEKEEYTKIIKVKYDYSNIKNEPEPELEEEEEEEEEEDYQSSKENIESSEKKNSKIKTNSHHKHDKISNSLVEFEEEEEENFEKSRNKKENLSNKLDHKSKTSLKNKMDDSEKHIHANSKNTYDQKEESSRDYNYYSNNSESSQKQANSYSEIENINKSEKDQQNSGHKHRHHRISHHSKTNNDDNFSHNGQQIETDESKKMSASDSHSKKNEHLDNNQYESSQDKCSKKTHKSHTKRNHQSGESSSELSSNSEIDHNKVFQNYISQTESESISNSLGKVSKHKKRHHDKDFSENSHNINNSDKNLHDDDSEYKKSHHKNNIDDSFDIKKSHHANDHNSEHEDSYHNNNSNKFSHDEYSEYKSSHHRKDSDQNLHDDNFHKHSHHEKTHDKSLHDDNSDHRSSHNSNNLSQSSYYESNIDDNIPNSHHLNKISDDESKNAQNFSYSQLSQINIKSDKKNINKDQNNKKKVHKTHDLPYIPKLTLSSIVPHEAFKKSQKHIPSNLSPSSSDQFKKLEIKQTDDEDENKNVLSIRYKDNSRRSKTQHTRNVPKRATSNRMSSKILPRTNDPSNNGYLFGPGVETKSSIIVKVKH